MQDGGKKGILKVFLKEYSNIHLNGETNRLRKMEEKNIPPKYSQKKYSDIHWYVGTSRLCRREERNWPTGETGCHVILHQLLLLL